MKASLLEAWSLDPWKPLRPYQEMCEVETILTVLQCYIYYFHGVDRAIDQKKKRKKKIVSKIACFLA